MRGKKEADKELKRAREGIAANNEKIAAKDEELKRAREVIAAKDTKIAALDEEIAGLKVQLERQRAETIPTSPPGKSTRRGKGKK